jgi:hypothetical protein
MEVPVHHALLHERRPLGVIESPAVADWIAQPTEQDVSRIRVHQIVEEIGIQNLARQTVDTLIQQFIECETQRSTRLSPIRDIEPKAVLTARQEPAH